MSIASRIQARLDALGLSASRASLDAGLGRSAVGDILAGNSESPRVATIEALSPVLKCSVVHLITGQLDEALDDGGPAFPGSYEADHKDRGPVEIHEPGMTLRDWFAGQALAGMLGNSGIRVTVGPDPGNDNIRLAACAFAAADAMLAERAKAVRS